MRCAELEDLLDLHVDGELASEARARVDRHLLRCPACAYSVRSLEQAKGLLGEAYPHMESAPGYRERAVARLRDQLADVLHSPAAEETTQWSLPFPAER